MVRAFLAVFTHEVRGMHEAAYLLAAFALSSQLLGLLRDRLFAGTFGAGETLDLYFAAFRVPDLLFATAASLLSLYALLPVLARLEEERPGLAASFLSQTLLVFFAGMGVIAGVLYLFAPVLAPLVAPGIVDEAARAQLVLLTQMLLLQPILLGASNILAALTQMRHRFALYAVSPLLYNLGIIAGITLLYPVLGITGLGWGVVLGAALHLGVQAAYFVRESRAPRLPAQRMFGGLREVLWLSVPRTATLAAGQVSLLILVALASLVAPGSIAVFTFAFNLQAVPLTIIGVSYSVAAFPTLARFYAAGNNADFLSHIESALRHILFWAIPATVLIVVLRAQIVRTILGAGVFDWGATRLTAAALALFVLALLAQSVVLLIARAYYAAGRTATPLYLAGFSVIVSVGSALALLFAFNEHQLVRSFLETLLRVPGLAGTPVLMLAFGYALGSIAQAALGLWFLHRDFRVSLRPLRRLAFQSFGASVVGGAAAYAMLWYAGLFVDINTLLGIFAQGVAGGVVGLAVTAGVLALLKNTELAETVAALRRRFKDTGAVALEPSELS
jgi:putative peptidoglycan lipid II flippase